MLRRSVLRNLAVAGAVACGGGGDSGGEGGTEPEPVFPEVPGTYDVRGNFEDGISGDTIVGLLELTQASREADDLTGTLSVSVILGGVGAILDETSTSNTHLSENGDVTFAISTSGGLTWTFNGSTTAGGITGVHVLHGATSELAGDWGAKKIEDALPPLSNYAGTYALATVNGVPLPVSIGAERPERCVWRELEAVACVGRSPGIRESKP